MGVVGLISGNLSRLQVLPLTMNRKRSPQPSQRWLLIVGAVAAVLCGCGEEPAAVSAEAPSAPAVMTPERAFTLHCAACHALEVPEDHPPDHANVLAPPAFAVATRYREVYPEDGQRLQAMMAYVAQPQPERALMRGAVRRFGSMPPMPLPEDTLRLASAYLVVTPFEEPSWFAEHRALERNRFGGQGRGRRWQSGDAASEGRAEAGKDPAEAPVGEEDD